MTEHRRIGESEPFALRDPLLVYELLHGLLALNLAPIRSPERTVEGKPIDQHHEPPPRVPT